MMVDFDHTLRVRDFIYMHQNFIHFVKREVHTIVFVLQIASRLSKKNKKNSSYLLDMMDIVVIYHSKRQRTELRMVKNTLSVSRYQKQRSLYLMILFDEGLNLIPVKLMIKCS